MRFQVLAKLTLRVLWSRIGSAGETGEKQLWKELAPTDRAGVYNLAHAEMADIQLAQKLDSIEQVAPELVVASNPGCLLHMERGARARGLGVHMVHLVEVLGRAYPAPAEAAISPISPSASRGPPSEASALWPCAAQA